MANRRRICTAFLLAAVAAPLTVSAQLTSTTTAPTTQRTPTVEAVPPDFVRVTADRYSAFCQQIDEAWVKQGLSQAKAKDLPTTRPADIISRVEANRDKIVNGLANELDIDPAKVTAFLDEQLTPRLKKLESVHPPVVFMVTTEQKIKTMLNGNWKHPRIHYNRLMGQLMWDERITLRVEEPMDEVLMRAPYESTDPPATRVQKLRDAAEKFESHIAHAVAAQARVEVQKMLMQFVETEVFTPMKLRDDQSWLQLGTVTWIAAKYVPMMTGTDPKQTLADMTFERPDSYYKADSIDLLHLPDLTSIRSEFIPALVDAARRKSTIAIAALVEQGGPEALRKALVAVKKDMPKDGIGLVSRVAAATSVDLNKQLRRTGG